MSTLHLVVGFRYPTWFRQLAVLADGAAWIWEPGQPAFPGRQIVNLYHAC